MVAAVEGIEPNDVPMAINAGLREALERFEITLAAKRAKEVKRQIRSGVNPEERRYA